MGGGAVGVRLDTAGKMNMESKSTGAQAGCEPSFERKKEKKVEP